MSWLRSLSPLQLTALTVGVSMSLLAVSAALTALVLVRLPADYFARERPLGAWTPGRLILRIAKNAAGVLLVALGILLSVPGVPGQGLLTILFGLMLLDFPGKYRLERWIVRKPGIRGPVDRLRARFGRPPLEVPD
jgi:hypothetical protein